MNGSTRIARAFASAWLVALAAAFFAQSAPAAEDHALEQLAGDWKGSEMIGGRPVAVSLKLSGMEAAAGNEFHYGVPRSCGLQAEYSGENEGKQIFSFSISSGGSCDKLIAGSLTVRLNSDGTLTYEATSNDRQTSWSGTLRKSR